MAGYRIKPVIKSQQNPLSSFPDPQTDSTTSKHPTVPQESSVWVLETTNWWTLPHNNCLSPTAGEPPDGICYWRVRHDSQSLDIRMIPNFKKNNWGAAAAAKKPAGGRTNLQLTPPENMKEGRRCKKPAIGRTNIGKRQPHKR
jgi:hypothetical protein